LAQNDCQIATIFMKVTGYCVKCKEKNLEMKDWKIVAMKRKGGKKGYAAKGVCPNPGCGTAMCRILSADQAAELKKAA